MINGYSTMNVYDFDGTIYDGDSTFDFYRFCLKRHPSIMVCLPKQIGSALLYKTKIINKLQFKQCFFCFLKKLTDVNQEVFYFWNLNEKKIKTWYRNQKSYDDVIVSASPDFLLEEICKRINIRHLVATKIDRKTGKFISKNCFGEEKVNRLRVYMPNIKIQCFYSDSYSDFPLAQISDKAFLVKGEQIIYWL